MLHAFSFRLIALALLLSLCAVPCACLVCRARSTSHFAFWKACLACVFMPLITCGFIIGGELAERALLLFAISTQQSQHLIEISKNLSLFIWRIFVFSMPFALAFNKIALITRPLKWLCILVPGLFWPFVALLISLIAQTFEPSLSKAHLAFASCIVTPFCCAQFAGSKARKAALHLFKKWTQFSESSVLKRLESQSDSQDSKNQSEKQALILANGAHCSPIESECKSGYRSINDQLTRCARPKRSFDSIMRESTVECAMDFCVLQSMQRQSKP